MGLQIWPWGLSFLVSFFCFGFIPLSSKTVAGDVRIVKGTVLIDGKSSIGKIDDDLICATLDWWPPEKCDYGTCSWDHASLLNLDLNNTILLKAIKAFSTLKIRLGGSLQDKVIYDTEDNQKPCENFVKDANEMFGFTQGCLTMHRWDKLNAFFRTTGAKVIFGLNALNGRSILPNRSAIGPWDSSNAESFIRYTMKKNYTIYGWELGNELSGKGVGVRVAADQYASDTISLHNIVQDIYSSYQSKPLIVAPGGNFEPDWYKEFLDKTTDSLQVISHHIYNLGPGSQSDEQLIEKILNATYLDNAAYYFSGLQNILKNSATSATAWIGEAGGAYNSGHDQVTNTFVFSFWYLDQLGMTSAYDTKTYCRQSLIGGNYGLLDTKTFVPNPDYYSALLWHQLMGRNVLSTKFSGTKKIRAYAHCSKTSQGITLLLINLDSSTAAQVNVTLHKQTARKIFPQDSKKDMNREEYHLTAKDGNLQSSSMLLNGNILTVDSDGDIPSLVPLHVNPSEPLMVAPLSIVFAHLPYVSPAACI